MLLLMLGLLGVAVQSAGPLAHAVPANHSTAGIKVFWHISTRNHWKAVVLEELGALMWSGLYDRCTVIHAYVTGSKGSTIQEAKAMVAHWGAKFTVHSPDASQALFERVTLEHIKDDVKPSDKFLYMHTKGVSGFDEPREYWRRYLLYFTIRHWRTCLCLLDRYDAVGANEWKAVHGHHFSGNFWWTTGAFWLRHNASIGDNYVDPEFYLLRDFPDAKTFELARQLHDMYAAPAWPSEYPLSMTEAMRGGAEGCLFQDY